MKFIYSDGGRSNYFRASDVGDCVTRAICNATGRDYLEVYKRLKELAKEESVKNHRGHKQSSVRDGVFKETWKKYLEEINWVRVKTMEFGEGSKGKKHLHLEDGALPSTGAYIVQVSKHLTCVKDGVLVDTYDCSRDGERMIYGYYRQMTQDELSVKQSIENIKAEEKRIKDERRVAERQQKIELQKQIKIIKDKYKKKMSPYKKKISALERQMKKEIENLSR